MKQALRVGGASTLNLYISRPRASGGATVAGIATFPWMYARHPIDDGVTIDNTTLPGGS